MKVEILIDHQSCVKSSMLIIVSIRTLTCTSFYRLLYRQLLLRILLGKARCKARFHGLCLIIGTNPAKLRHHSIVAIVVVLNVPLGSDKPTRSLSILIVLLTRIASLQVHIWGLGEEEWGAATQIPIVGWLRLENLRSLLQSLLELLRWSLMRLLLLESWLWLVVLSWLRRLWCLDLNLRRWRLPHLSFESSVLDILISSYINCLNLVDLFEEIRDICLVQLRRGLGFCLASDSSLLRVVNSSLGPNLLLNTRLDWQLIVDRDALRFRLQLTRQGLVQTLRCHIFYEFVTSPLQRVLMDLDRWERDWLDGSLSIELDLSGNILA